MGFTTASHGDISDWTIDNCAFFGTKQSGQFLVQSLHGNVLANTLSNPFVAFADGVFSNFAVPGSDRGGCFGTFVSINTSQNICEFYFAREGNYPVHGGRMEGSGQLFKTGSGSYDISVTFNGLRINDFHGNGVMAEINTAGSFIFNGCHMHRQDNQTWTDMITLNAVGGYGTIIIDGGATKATNLIRKVGGGGQFKLYTRGVREWQAPNAVNTARHIPDVNGQLF